MRERGKAGLLFLFLAVLGVLTVLTAAMADAQGTCADPRKGLVILVDFPDVVSDTGADFARDRFNKLDQYVREMSYGRTCLDLTFSGWHKLPDPVGRYAISPSNLKVDKSRVYKLIQDSIDAVDPSQDISRYSFVVLFLRSTFKEYGMVGLCGYPGMLGWSQEIAFKTKSGQTVPGGVAIFTRSAHIGTLFHDIAHIWGGVKNGRRQVPCLYDHDIQADHPTRERNFEKAMINMGYWDPMSCHFYERNVPPPGLSSWTKLRLGWIPPEKVRTVNPARSEVIRLGPLEDPGSENLVIRIPITESTFYLVENRQPAGGIPGTGVLIMYGDDSVDECRHGRSPVRLMNARPWIPFLKGAAFDVTGNREFVDDRNNIRIRIVEKRGTTYVIGVDRPK